MEKLNVLLVCGGGASSGFLAVSMRKAAKQLGIDLEVMAKSEAQIDDYKDSIHVLLIGPHLRYIEKDIQVKLADTNVRVAFIDDFVYGTLNGEMAVNQVIELMEGA